MKPLVQTGLALAVLMAANGAALLPNRIELRSRPRRVHHRERIEAARPDVVLIGNSILREGVDIEALSLRTGRRCLEVARSGAASAWWYLALKNEVAAARRPPEWVVIVFRDPFLTEPEFRVTGKYRQALDALAGAAEPVLARLAYGEAPRGGLLQRSLPLYSRRAELRESLERAVKDAWVGRILGLEPGGVDAALERVFRRDALDPERLAALQAESEEPPAGAYAFGARVQHSFLPEIVEVARARGIRLVFVRAKRRRDLAAGAQPTELVAYRRGLESWLAERGIPLLDFSDDPRLVETHYADGDHLGPAGRRVFTRLLAEALAPSLGASRSPQPTKSAAGRDPEPGQAASARPGGISRVAARRPGSSGVR